MSNKFIINPSSVDFNEIYQDLEDHILSTPESLRWKDDYNNSAGRLIKELLAGNAAFKKVEAIFARREAYLASAQNRSSVIGMAQYKGYSVFRGSNAKLSAIVTPNFTGTLPRLSVIGSVIDIDLVLMEDTAFIEGQPVEIKMTVGDVKTEEVQIQSGRPGMFRFYRNTVSDDYALYLNDVKVETSQYLLDASYGKFIVLTNPMGSVDVFYLNDVAFTDRYMAGDKLTLKYVNLDNKNFSLINVNSDIGDLNNIIFDSNFSEEETVENIKVNAPIYAETQYVVRAREDYMKIFKLLESSIVSTHYKNISPMVVRLYYVRSDGVLYTQAEKDDLIARLSINRNMGLEPPEIGDASRAKISINVQIKMYKITGTIIQDTQKIIDGYESILGTLLDFEEIEHGIEDFEDVKVARVTINTTPWSANTIFETEEHISPTTPNGFAYKVRDILRKSGNVEPDWPLVVGDTVIDNDLVWKCKYLERQCDVFNPQMPIIPPRGIWLSGRAYQVGEIVIPSTLGIYEYELVGYINKSGFTEPVWPSLAGSTIEEFTGTEVSDDRLVWRARGIIGSPDAWEGDKHYDIGSVVVATDPDASDTSGVMFQLITVSGRTSGTQPTWPTNLEQTVDDGSIRWECVNPNVSPKALSRDRYYKIERTITL